MRFEKVRTENAQSFTCDRCGQAKTSRTTWRYQGARTLCNGCHGHVERFGA